MIVNNRETYEGEHIFYVDTDKVIHEATITALAEEDGKHYAEVEFEKDGSKQRVTWVPHNTSVEAHSWNHPMTSEERETHYHPNFYG